MSKSKSTFKTGKQVGEALHGIDTYLSVSEAHTFAMKIAGILNIPEDEQSTFIHGVSSGYTTAHIEAKDED